MIVLVGKPDENWRASLLNDVTETVGTGATMAEAIGNLMLIISRADDAISATERVDFAVRLAR